MMLKQMELFKYGAATDSVLSCPCQEEKKDVRKALDTAFHRGFRTMASAEV
jgi:hypothetical protein